MNLGFTIILLIFLSAIHLSIKLSQAQEAHSVWYFGNQPEGRFKNLQDSIYPTYKPHLSDKLSFSGYYQWKREASARYGIDYLYSNAPIYQMGSRGNESYFDNLMDLYVQWRLFEEKTWSGKIFFWGLYIQTLSGKTGQEFADSQGLITSPNDGATDPNRSFVSPSALWWEQSFCSNRFIYRIGQLNARSLWGTNKYLNDDRYSFMNSVLSTNQGVPWFDGTRGLGAMASVQNEWFYMSGGFQDAKADQEKIDFTSFGGGKFVYLGELGFTPTFGIKNKGKYKLTIGYVEKTGDNSRKSERNGWGLTLSIRQDFSEGFGLYGVYRHSWDREVGGVKGTAGAGVVFTRPFGWVDDWLGIGYFLADPSDPALEKEHGFEIYWRLQLTHRLEFTPDLQVYLTPAKADGNSRTIVFGLRFRYLL
jgi:hypothetical protein